MAQGITNQFPFVYTIVKLPIYTSSTNSSLFQCQTMSETPLVNIRDFTLAGPTVTRLEPDPLAVLSLNNQLFIWAQG